MHDWFLIIISTKKPIMKLPNTKPKVRNIPFRGPMQTTRADDRCTPISNDMYNLGISEISESQKTRNRCCIVYLSVDT